MAPPDGIGSDPLLRLCQGLEPAQAAVLAHDFASQGPLLVLAGAGTGKTTTLTRRLALELARGAPADEILALTFTRKAAREMRERVAVLLPPGTGLPEIRTFHALGLALLSESGGRGWVVAGWTGKPKLLAEEDQSKASAEFWRQRFRSPDPSVPSPATWTRLIAEWGHPDRYERSGGGPGLEAWREWEAWKRRLGIAEMHDLIAGASLALERDPELLDRWRQRSQTLFVDEYQDTDRSQYHLVSMLAGTSRRLVAVGDDDQAIYGFRGADMRNVLDWKTDRPDGRILSLIGNHRSKAPILVATNRLFPDKPGEFRKLLEARRPSRDGAKPVWFRARGADEELDWIRSRVESELRRGTAPAEICVLHRSNREEPALRKALWGLPLARDEEDGICLSTIHAAKGLEWSVVVVCSQDRPRAEGDALAPFAQDEERRLFYVACTRARDRLYMSCCETRPQGRRLEPRRPHPWMGLIEADVRIRPLWILRQLRRIWEPAARRARQT